MSIHPNSKANSTLSHNCYKRKGLADVLGLITSSPELKPNKFTDNEDKKQKLNRIRSADTASDSEQKDEDLFVSQHSSKPHVIRNLYFR